MYIYSVDIFIRYKKRYELYDSDIIVTDRLYNTILIQTYRYNRHIVFIKKTTRIK